MRLSELHDNLVLRIAQATNSKGVEGLSKTSTRMRALLKNTLARRAKEVHQQRVDAVERELRRTIQTSMRFAEESWPDPWLGFQYEHQLRLDTLVEGPLIIEFRSTPVLADDDDATNDNNMYFAFEVAMHVSHPSKWRRAYYYCHILKIKNKMCAALFHKTDMNKMYFKAQDKPYHRMILEVVRGAVRKYNKRQLRANPNPDLAAAAAVAAAAANQ